ncbi:nucleoside triphosphate pyrophosphatase [Thermoactinomyces sp. DSM 45892]|uniref:Maf family protein n=1 Tax=Thermoactinomyces sp. DSM 45892 TaxID=1882753 RepID=UPI000897978C|nr:Maf family protein [Thermoactinomyces sp. DSM 45892]SDY80122.1 septum formation protein [Thermoactinomyces sp. DSM 45892]
MYIGGFWTKEGAYVEIVLASSSPRRRELLAHLKVDFRVRTSEVSEEIEGLIEPSEVVEILSLRKAAKVAEEEKNAWIIGADTIVVQGGKILGKPSNPADAFEMLSSLQGTWHQVFSGISLIEVRDGEVKRRLSRHAITDVWMNSLSDQRMNWYIETGEPMDKAGSYGIQGYGASFIEKIEGCYFNVVGMSLSLLAEMLETCSCPLYEKS